MIRELIDSWIENKNNNIVLAIVSFFCWLLEITNNQVDLTQLMRLK